MVPFRFEDYHIPSNMSRDPLMLYPYWAVHFYFNESIGGNVGIQVGVWGDTGEILYCSGFGYYGVPVTLNEQDSVILPSDDQPSGGQKQPNPSNLSTLAIAVSLAAIPLISISAIALRHKKRHQ
jgi:hypothetical protein